MVIYKKNWDSMVFGLIRTIIFTLGHYSIDVCCTHFIAGAPWEKAMVSGMVSPLLNAVWYFILDRIFFGYIVPKVKKGH